jgi:hypothetical protein
MRAGRQSAPSRPRLEQERGASASRRFTYKRGIPALALALGLAAPPVALAAHEVTITRGNAVVGVIKSAQCVRRKHGGFPFIAHHKRTGSGWGLFVHFATFAGFHHIYDLHPGAPNDEPYVVVTSPTDVRYSNLYVPPFPAPGFGQIRFSNNGKLMGVGYFPTWDQGAGDAVIITGVLKCHYPKKKH